MYLVVHECRLKQFVALAHRLLIILYVCSWVALYIAVYGIIIVLIRCILLTLGAHAQRGLRYLPGVFVCVCVC